MPLKYITLMNKDREVLRFTRDLSHIDILDQNLLPIPLKSVSTPLCTDSFSKWLSRRSLPALRRYAKSIYNSLQIPYPDNLELLYRTRGLSLNDSYWLKVEDDDTWDKLNLFDNLFSESVAHTALTGEVISIISRPIATNLILTPEATTDGTFAKCWRRENGKLLLYKSDDTNNSIYSEYLASLIADVLELNHVKYDLTNYRRKLCTVCENMCSKDIGIIPMDMLTHLLGTASAPLDKWLSVPTISNNREDFLKMLIFDGLIGNTDRHLGNWGFLYNTDTNTLLNLHPLFDHNISINPSPYSDDPYITEQPFLENLTIVEAAKRALSLLPQFRSNLYKLEEWYKSLKTQELFYKLYDREDELNYLLQLLHDIVSTDSEIRNF